MLNFNSVTDVLSAIAIVTIVFNFAVSQYKIKHEVRTLKRIIIKIAKKLKIELFDVDLK